VGTAGRREHPLLARATIKIRGWLWCRPSFPLLVAMKAFRMAAVSDTGGSLLC